MEKFALTLKSQSAIDAYLADNHLMPYERDMMDELIAVIGQKDEKQLAWFAGFGDSFRQILMNVHEHRKALEFGFTEVSFNRYGWFAAPKFLDMEEITLEQSRIRLGRGLNFIWAYALSCNYGTAGDSGPLCVFCKKYPNREMALTAALAEMKAKMSKYVGHSDTTNYKQEVIGKTLKMISQAEIRLVQLTLF